METKVFYVAVVFGPIQPTIVKKFDNLTDAESYAAYKSRTRELQYIVLEQQTEFDGTPQENA